MSESPSPAAVKRAASLTRRDSFVKTQKFAVKRTNSILLPGSPRTLGDQNGPSSPNLLLLDNGGGQPDAVTGAPPSPGALNNAAIGAAAVDDDDSASTRSDDPDDAKPALDYRENFQKVLNRITSDTRDLEAELIEFKVRIVDVIPRDRKVDYTIMRYKHLRSIPRRGASGDVVGSLSILQGPPGNWDVGLPMVPSIKVQLLDKDEQPIPAWAANIEIRAYLLNGIGDWILERYDGRSILLGNVAYLEGWEAEFPHLRIMDPSSHHKQGTYRLAFVASDFAVQPVITEPFVITQTPYPKDMDRYMYDEEEEVEVGFAVPAEETEERAAGAEADAAPLHVAASLGQRELCKLLLARGDEVDEVAQHGLTPLHIAAYLGSLSLVEVLVDHEAEINAPSNNGMTPLHFALLNGHTEVAFYLLTSRDIDPRVNTNRGWTPLHLAARTGNSKAIKRLIEFGGDIDLRNRDGQTALHIAVFNGHVECMEILVAAGAQINSATKGGWTCAHLAVLGGNSGVLRSVIDLSGAIDNKLDACDYTPLHIAAENARADLIAMLLKAGANPKSLSRSGFSPAHFAAIAGDPSVLEMLLDVNSPVYNTREGTPTAAHLAMAYGQVQLLEQLTAKIPKELLTDLDEFNERIMPTAALLIPMQSAATGEHVPVLGQLAAHEEGVRQESRNWKRGDKADWPTYVELLRAGSWFDREEVLKALVDDAPESEREAKELLRWNADQPLRLLLKRKELPGTIVSKSLELMRRLSHHAVPSHLITNNIITDLYQHVTNGIIAMELLKLRLNDASVAGYLDPQDRQRMQNFETQAKAMAGDYEKHLKPHAQNGDAHGDEEDEVSNDEPPSRAEIAALANPGSRHQSRPQSRQNGHSPAPAPVTPVQQQQQQQRHSQHPAEQAKKPAPVTGPAAEYSSKPNPRVERDDHDADHASNNNNNSSSNAAGYKPSKKSNGTPNKQHVAEIGDLQAQNTPFIGSGKISEKVLSLLPEQSNYGVMLVGRSGSGKSTLVTEACGLGKHGRAMTRVTDNGSNGFNYMNRISACSYTAAGKKLTYYNMLKGLDPGADSSVESWDTLIQFITDSNSQADVSPIGSPLPNQNSNGNSNNAAGGTVSPVASRSPLISCVWWCIDPNDAGSPCLDVTELEWLQAVSELVPVVIVITRAATSRSAANECKRFVENFSPRIPFFGNKALQVHARVVGATEEHLGFADLAGTTHQAILEFIKSNTTLVTITRIAPKLPSMSRQAKLQSSAALIAPSGRAATRVAQGGVGVGHLGSTLSEVTFPMFASVGYILGVPFGRDGIVDVWLNIFGTEERPNKDVVKKLALLLQREQKSGAQSAPATPSAAESGKTPMVLDSTSCSVLVTALGLSYANICLEMACEGSLRKVSTQVLAASVLAETETLCKRGRDTVFAELSRIQSGAVRR